MAVKRQPTAPFIALNQETLAKTSQPIYVAVRDMIAEKIRNQELKPGDRLPPDMELAKSLGINHITLAKALNQLRNEGFLERYRRQGTFVKRGIEADSRYGANGRLVGYLVDQINPQIFHTSLFASVQQALEASDCAMKILSAQNNSEIQFEQLKALIQNGRVCGCIIWSIMEPRHIKKILKIKPPTFPIVFLDRCYDGLETDFSGYDDFHAGQLLGSHLLDKNYSDIYVPVLPEYLEISTVQERLAGLKEVYGERVGHADGVRICRANDNNDFVSITSGVCLDRKKSIGLVGVNDTTAIYILEVVRSLGLRIPEDVAVGSFETRDVLARLEYDITAIRLPVEQMGKHAVEILISRLNGDTRKSYHIRTKGSLVIRHSTDPLKQSELPQYLTSRFNRVNKSMVEVGR